MFADTPTGYSMDAMTLHLLAADSTTSIQYSPLVVSAGRLRDKHLPCASFTTCGTLIGWLQRHHSCSATGTPNPLLLYKALSNSAVVVCSATMVLHTTPLSCIEPSVGACHGKGKRGQGVRTRINEVNATSQGRSAVLRLPSPVEWPAMPLALCMV